MGSRTVARASWKAEREDRLSLLCLECFPGETWTRSAGQASEGRSSEDNGSSRGPMILQARPAKSSRASTRLLCCQTLATDLLRPHPPLLSLRLALSRELCLWGRLVHPSIFPDSPLSHQAHVPPLPEHGLRMAAPAIQTGPASLRLRLLLSAWSSPQSC